MDFSFSRSGTFSLGESAGLCSRAACAAYNREMHRAREDTEVSSLDPTWNAQRNVAFKILTSQVFEVTLAMVILFNVVMTILETDARAAEDFDTLGFYLWITRVLLIIYCFEIGLRLFVLRSAFFQRTSNIIDFLVVAADLLCEVFAQVIGVIPSISVLRIIRIIRLLRAVKVIMLFPELYWMIRGMMSAFRALVWGIVFVTALLLLWAIVAVEILHPLNQQVALTGVYDDCDRCAVAFQSVFQSVITFVTQIIASDDWGRISVPIIMAYPWTVVLFLAILFSINLGALNLILAVILDRAQQSHEEDIEHTLHLKAQEYEQARSKLRHLCATMDHDASGNLSMEEIQGGYDKFEEFANALNAMDVNKEDLAIVFNILDQDQSGDVSYDEFVDQLYRMKSSDGHTMLIFIKHFVTEMNIKVSEQLALLKDFVKSRYAIQETKNLENSLALDRMARCIENSVAPLEFSNSVGCHKDWANDGTANALARPFAAGDHSTNTAYQNSSTSETVEGGTAEPPPKTEPRSPPQPPTAPPQPSLATTLATDLQAVRAAWRLRDQEELSDIRLVLQELALLSLDVASSNGKVVYQTQQDRLLTG